MTGIVLLKFSDRKLFPIDYCLTPIFAWFVIFSREPYAPLALFLFATILWGKFDKIKKISIAIFAVFSTITLLYISDLKGYFFNIVTVNYSTVFTSEANTNNLIGPKIFQIFLYPFYILIQGNWNLFRQLLIGIDIIFIALLFSLIRNRQFFVVVFILLLLGLANLRIIVPGSIFYNAFHMIVWYGLFIFITTALVFWHFKNRLMFIFSMVVILMFLFSFLTSKFYFAYEKIDQHAELLTNYGETMQIGEVVKILSDPSDTLFLDGSDDLIYWQAQRTSPYKYSWYTSVMRHFPKYSKSRLDMFKNNPPDFYKEFGSCP
ncbi:MAG: hypothetical protein HY427_01905, partial [Candidatus Levybacteria bacterium]|nr:hypothetical protein [Candidatus Levybacteria bacterium]